MKKMILLLTAFTLSTILLHAQQKKSRFLIELSAGPSFPVGQFAGKNFEDNDLNSTPSGLAKTGIGTQLSLGYLFNKHVGVLLVLGYSSHARDMSSFENELRSLSAATGDEVVDSDNWKVTKIMTGIYGGMPMAFQKKLSLTTRLALGVIKTSRPAYSYVYNKSLQYVGKKEFPLGPCFQVSTGLKYELNNKLHVLLDGNWTDGFIGKEELVNTRPQTRVLSTTSYRLGNVSVMAGVGLTF